MSKEASTYSRLLLEMFSILLAVLIAFTLENWRDEQKNDDLAELAVQDIIRELIENKKMIAKKDSSFNLFISELSKAILKPKDTTINFNYSLHNYQFSSWETAQLSQAISYMEFKTVKNFKNCYFLLDFAKKLSNNIVSNIVSPDFYIDEKSLAVRKSIQINALSLKATNKSLKELLHKVITKYETKSD